MDIDTDSNSSDAESDIFSLASAPTTTTHDTGLSPRSSSPARSMVLSVTSSMREQIYKEEFGRNLNNYSEVYRLPADEEELERLGGYIIKRVADNLSNKWKDKQHEMLLDIMGGKYVPPMAAVMADDTPGEKKTCLDLGCGTGSWIMDVARDFPNCIAVGTDLIPMQSPIMPPNLRSEVDDINLGLEHFYGDFNVVHVRLISSGIKDYNLLIDQMSRVLRPGGLIDISEFDFRVYDVNRRPLEPDINDIRPPWWALWMSHMLKAIIKSGGDPDAATHLHEWILDHPAFEDVVYREFWLPVVPPARDTSNDSEEVKQMDKKLSDDCYGFLRAGRPLLLGYGFEPEKISMLEENALEELRTRKTTQYTRLQCVYARKRQTQPYS